MKHNRAPHHFLHVLGRTEKIQLQNQIDSERMQRRKRAENDNQLAHFQDESKIAIGGKFH
jgi:hypothetical protein